MLTSPRPDSARGIATVFFVCSAAANGQAKLERGDGLQRRLTDRVLAGRECKVPQQQSDKAEIGIRFGRMAGLPGNQQTKLTYIKLIKELNR